MSERGFMQKAWDAQRRLEKKWSNIGKGRYARVLKMARKPDPEEFKRSSLVVLVGIGVIGFIGFLIFLLLDWIQGSVLNI